MPPRPRRHDSTQDDLFREGPRSPRHAFDEISQCPSILRCRHALFLDDTLLPLPLYVIPRHLVSARPPRSASPTADWRLMGYRASLLHLMKMGAGFEWA